MITPDIIHAIFAVLEKGLMPDELAKIYIDQLTEENIHTDENGFHNLVLFIHDIMSSSFNEPSYSKVLLEAIVKFEEQKKQEEEERKKRKEQKMKLKEMVFSNEMVFSKNLHITNPEDIKKGIELKINNIQQGLNSL